MSIVDQINGQLMIVRRTVTPEQTGGLTVTLPAVPEQPSLLLVLKNGVLHSGVSVSGQEVQITGEFALNDAVDIFYPKTLWEGLAGLAAKGAEQGENRTVEMAQVDAVETFTTWLRSTLSSILPALDDRLTALAQRATDAETRLTTVEAELEALKTPPAPEAV
jgi:hypothetical protein